MASGSFAGGAAVADGPGDALVLADGAAEAKIVGIDALARRD